MKTVRLLVMLSAFLIMVSSAFSLGNPSDSKTPVYINVAAMACLVAIVTLLNFKSKPKDNL